MTFFFTASILVILGALCIFIATQCQARKNAEKISRKPYAFSLLRDGNSFFDDDEKEVEIFKRPSKGKLIKLKLNIKITIMY